MTTSAKPSVYSLLPAHPKDIYPDWEINEASRDDYENADFPGGSHLMDDGYNSGPMSYYHGHNVIPAGFRDFIMEQFIRFKVAPPCELLISWAWEFTFYYVDVIDPEIFFYGCCDVIKTEEPYFYQYTVLSDAQTDYTEVPPSSLEFFRTWNKGTDAWEVLMGYPGLEHFFDYFKDHFDTHWLDAGDAVYNGYASRDCEESILINQYGKVQATNLAHLAAWSTIMWMMSPMAKGWRAEKHPVFAICYEFGECLIHEWCFHTPEYYRRENRPAMTCSSCGHTEWCVELVQVSSSETRYICEHCLNPVPQKWATCGIKPCTKISCPHHPGQRAARQIAAEQRYGELKMLENGRKGRDCPGIMYINTAMIDKYSTSIADAVGEDLRKLLTF